MKNGARWRGSLTDLGQYLSCKVWKPGGTAKSPAVPGPLKVMVTGLARKAIEPVWENWPLLERGLPCPEYNPAGDQKRLSGSNCAKPRAQNLCWRCAHARSRHSPAPQPTKGRMGAPHGAGKRADHQTTLIWPMLRRRRPQQAHACHLDARRRPAQHRFAGARGRARRKAQHPPHRATAFVHRAKVLGAMTRVLKAQRRKPWCQSVRAIKKEFPRSRRKPRT